jgi:hypothetical protein
MLGDKRKLRRELRTDFTPSVKLRLIRGLFRLRQASHIPGLLLNGNVTSPVFVIGAPRSGTSLLYYILRASSRLAHWPGEAHEVWEADHHPALRGWRSNSLDASDVTDETAARIRRSFFLVTGSRRSLIDKTPRNALRVPFVDALFPDARYVYLQRDGRDNVNSLINAWRTPRYRTYLLPEPHAIPGVDPRWWKFVLYEGWREDRRGPLEVVCARQWIACNEAALDAATSIGPERWWRTRYEDLVDDPETEIAKIVDFLGLPYAREIEERAAAVKTTPINVVTPPEAGKWRRENPAEIEAVMPLIRPTMERLGYGIDED